MLTPRPGRASTPFSVSLLRRCTIPLPIGILRRAGTLDHRFLPIDTDLLRGQRVADIRLGDYADGDIPTAAFSPKNGGPTTAEAGSNPGYCW